MGERACLLEDKYTHSPSYLYTVYLILLIDDGDNDDVCCVNKVVAFLLAKPNTAV